MSNLKARLEQFGSKPALVFRGSTISYAELCERANAFTTLLTSEGIAPGECVALRGDFSPNTVALLIALTDNRCIAVPFGRSAHAQHASWFEIAQVTRLFDFNEDDTWSLSRVPWRGEANPLLAQLRSDGRAGIVFFSSGTSGAPKAMLHAVDRILEKFARPRAPRRTLSFLLLDHAGGINTLFGILTGGGTLVAPEGRTPDAICALIQEHRVELLPTTPTFLNVMLLAEAHQRYDLSSLELITYGTEPMPESTLRAVHRALPGVRIKQTYGLSELGALATRSESDDSLWIQIGGAGYEAKVEGGTLRIRTKMAMLGYLNAPSPFDAEGWMDTGDAVEVRGDYVRVLGRQSELINVGGQKVFPQEVENVILGVPNVKDVLVQGRASPLVGQVVVATVRLARPEPVDEVRKRVREFCKDKLDAFKIPAVVTVTESDLSNERMKKARTRTAHV
ncbi:class I adenylate-forming enzyme family protein [Cystobacter fuscus]|uniref:class I adenylate-forming enzyme family protein n=1 Tax=Cystobacter fuscus TaxID=43 RepID=UPI0006877167|nr:fatty acid--CoA ligase family protein [Cystobacter fuscus]